MKKKRKRLRRVAGDGIKRERKGEKESKRVRERNIYVLRYWVLPGKRCKGASHGGRGRQAGTEVGRQAAQASPLQAVAAAVLVSGTEEEEEVVASSPFVEKCCIQSPTPTHPHLIWIFLL